MIIIFLYRNIFAYLFSPQRNACKEHNTYLTVFYILYDHNCFVAGPRVKRNEIEIHMKTKSEIQVTATLGDRGVATIATTDA